MSVLDILLCSLSTFIHIDNKICLVGPSPTQTAFHANLISSKALRCPCRCRLLWLQGMGIEVCVGGGGMGSLFVLTVFISSFQLVFFLFRLKCIYFFPRSFLPANRKSCICICLGISHNNNIETDLRLCKPNRVEPSSVPDSIRKLQRISLCATVRICMELLGAEHGSALRQLWWTSKLAIWTEAGSWIWICSEISWWRKKQPSVHTLKLSVFTKTQNPQHLNTDARALTSYQSHTPTTTRFPLFIYVFYRACD